MTPSDAPPGHTNATVLGRFSQCRFYAQTVSNFLVLTLSLCLFTFLLYLAFEGTPEDFRFSSVRSQFGRGVAALVPCALYMLWVDGVLVPVLVLVWGLFVPIRDSDAVPHSALRRLAVVILGIAFVGQVFAFLVEVCIFLPAPLRYVLFQFPREVISAFLTGLLKSITPSSCKYFRPFFSRLHGVESTPGDSRWKRYYDVHRYETEGICRKRSRQGGKMQSVGLDCPPGLQWHAVCRSLLAFVRRRNFFAFRSCLMAGVDDDLELSAGAEEQESGLQCATSTDHENKKTGAEAVPYEKTKPDKWQEFQEHLTEVDALEKRRREMVERGALKLNAADEIKQLDAAESEASHSSKRTSPTGSPRRTEMGIADIDDGHHQDIAPTLAKAGTPAEESVLRKFCATMWFLFGLAVELPLLLMAGPLFVIEPFLFRFVNYRDPKHYVICTHGMGANTANWVYGRYFLACQDYVDNVIFPTYLGGLFAIDYNGNVRKCTSKVSADVAAQLSRILETKQKEAENRQKVVADKDTHEKLVYSPINREVPMSEAREAPITVSLVGHSLGGMISVNLAHELFPDQIFGGSSAKDTSSTTPTTFLSDYRHAASSNMQDESRPQVRSRRGSSVSEFLGESAVSDTGVENNTDDPHRQVVFSKTDFLLHSVVLLSSPLCGSDFVLTGFRLLPSWAARLQFASGADLWQDLSPQSPQGKQLCERLCALFASDNIPGGVHLLGGTTDFLVFPYSAFALRLRVRGADLRTETSFEIVTNVGHYNVAISSFVWRAIFSRVDRGDPF
ncbi:unnamed protein product [Amoebophrya sp. A120]|nr:unnamed protein product [Amoebophrya sp. A120]|eukprot:GSA120T00003045001.1